MERVRLQVFSDILACQSAVRAARSKGETVGLVPTMGALHDGHLSLIHKARDRSDHVAVTIFINPTQFAPGEDFEKYPKQLEADLSLCRSGGADWVFAPGVQTMYPRTPGTVVHVSGVTDGLCGRFRPGHFDGVTTVVAKLFHIIPADFAFFGEKDYQQLVTIRRMVSDLNIPIEIVGCSTVRESDGLALSSRNSYLTPTQRAQVRVLSAALFAAADRIRAGITCSAKITGEMRQSILAAGPFLIDYIEIVDPQTLQILSGVSGPARICLAVRIGSCRLIDNVAVDAPPPSS